MIAPSTNAASCNPGTGTVALEEIPATLRLKTSRGFAFALITLAISVSLWGFGYKLSLYAAPGVVSRTPVAKLWDKHPTPPECAASSQTRRQHGSSCSYACSAQVFTLTEIDLSILRGLEFDEVASALHNRRPPARSPPSVVFLTDSTITT